MCSTVWDQSQSSRFNWLWYDVTTFESYCEETSYEDSLMVQQSGALALSSLTHVFRSLTPNARGIFILIASHQLEEKDRGSYNGKADILPWCTVSLDSGCASVAYTVPKWKNNLCTKIRKFERAVVSIRTPVGSGGPPPPPPKIIVLEMR